MARKKRGKRVAAKQAQLSRRNKKGRGPSGIPTMSAAQRRRQPAAASQTTGAEATPAQAMPSTAAATSPTPQPMAAAAVAARQPLVYSYVGKELRRIVTLSGVIITAIVVLSFFIN